MSDKDKVKKFTMIFIALTSLISLAISLKCYNDNDLFEKKMKNVIHELEELKFEMEDLKKLKNSGSNHGELNGSTDMFYLQNKLNKMRSELEILRKNKNSKLLEEYKAEKNKFWMEYADGVKKSWTAFFQQRLEEKGIEQDDIESIKSDYNNMLDKIRDEQLRWYEGDSTIEDLNNSTKKYVKEFYEDMSNSVGEQKASIALAIAYPDQMFRKSLFDEEN